MKPEIKIEKGIPMPDRATHGFASTFKKMQVGDSVLFPKRTSFSAMARQLGGTVATRKEGDGIRVWRTA